MTPALVLPPQHIDPINQWRNIMGYFSNGTEGMSYEEQYCSRCLHGPECTVWLAHMLYNYDECNNEKSILHLLIPLSKDGCGNEQCTMFMEDPHHNQEKLPL